MVGGAKTMFHLAIIHLVNSRNEWTFESATLKPVPSRSTVPGVDQ
jgi:hypothetical protein